DWNWDEKASGVRWGEGVDVDPNAPMDEIIAAIDDPHQRTAAKGATGYRQATAGDYDLFLVWSSSADRKREPTGTVVNKGRGRKVALADLPLVAGALGKPKQAGETNFGKRAAKWEKQEHPVLANPSLRQATVRAMLNDELRRTGGYRGGDMVHHSAEQGRPFIDDISTPSIIFLPSGQIRIIQRRDGEDDTNSGALDLMELFLEALGVGVDEDGLDCNYEPLFNINWLPVLERAIPLLERPEHRRLYDGLRQAMHLRNFTAIDSFLWHYCLQTVSAGSKWWRESPTRKKPSSATAAKVAAGLVVVGGLITLGVTAKDGEL
ncbi:MAG: hypothetical protein KC431_23915, partial [Myxococcales bacterium]|nr:hypothetical protein [Myxococcales bacterium]